MRRFMSAVLVAASLSLLPSCALFRTACDKTMPALVEAQSLGFNAQSALDEARDAIERSDLSPQAKANAYSAITRAQAGLSAATKSLAALSVTCSQPDLGSIFEAFILAWDGVRGFLSLVGGHGTAHVEDPAVWVIARGSR